MLSREEFKNKYPNGFYGKDLNNPRNKKGIWNSCEWIGDKMYRVRSEMIILKDVDTVYPKIFIGPKSSRKEYNIPGGSTEPKYDAIKTAIKETQEEARINTKQVKLISKYVDNLSHTWDIILNDDNETKIKYDGNIVYVCVSQYDSVFNGYVSKSDRDDKMYKEGKFLPLELYSCILTDAHRNAVNTYLATIK